MKQEKKVFPLETMRHSTAHLLAAAVIKLYPGTKLGVGPVVEHGFYYDMETPEPLSIGDFGKIEKMMKRIKEGNLSYIREEMPLSRARALMKELGQTYKLELLDDIERYGTTKIGDQVESTLGKKDGEVMVSVYRTGDFVDLCQGPHVDTTKDIGAFKLRTIAGAYWRGDEKNPQLTRIYGYAFGNQEELDAHLTMMKEAEKRDHRKLGKELELFTFDDDVGPGLPLWLPNGAVLIEEIETLAKETEYNAGYVRVRTPHIAKESLYITSGHLPYYKESMFPPMDVDGTNYYLKAMNCPHHHKIFAATAKSYRNLPLRLAEYGTCYRYEQSGELLGLMRVRSLQMNDAHIYCTKEQFETEFRAVNEMYLTYFKIFGIEKYVMRFSTHDPKKLGEKYVNEPELWKKTEDMVRDVLISSNIPYVEVPNEAAFYGPKIDVQVWSAIGREFTLATNQVDFAVPARFGLTYINTEGKAETPLCIHRAPLGTHERFIGFLIEHFAGAFPLWLSPVQVAVISVGLDHVQPAKKLTALLRERGIRAHVHDENESVGYKIREAEKSKVPFMVVVGDKEADLETLAIRARGSRDISDMGMTEFIERVTQAIASKKLTL
ncbi:MAG: threonine--tRNA ligase [bacterium]|nr:threonine--tRNA ligase [bacterium]